MFYRNLGASKKRHSSFKLAKRILENVSFVQSEDVIFVTERSQILGPLERLKAEVGPRKVLNRK